MKTDAQLKKDVQAELDWDPAVDATQIGVAVKDGVTTLTGHIATFAEKYAAERALRRVAGVKAIALELDVRLAPDHRRSDTDIALAAENALKWNTMVPDKVRVTVDKGWVTLRGELEWEYQRRGVENAIRPLMGVVGVSNDITLKPQVTASGVKTKIEEALRRQTEREAARLDIKVDGATVTLKGTVHSFHERDAAQGAAWYLGRVDRSLGSGGFGPDRARCLWRLDTWSLSAYRLSGGRVLVRDAPIVSPAARAQYSPTRATPPAYSQAGADASQLVAAVRGSFA